MRLVEALDARQVRVIALVGAGGKTTIMYRLAGELASLGSRVIVTTTTRIYPPSPGEVDGNVLSDDLAGLREGVRSALRERQVVGAGLGVGEDGKVWGIPAHWVAELARLADSVIVEADGAARKPFKAPADHEPVIPAAAALVVAVAGVDAVGLALQADNVQRPERIAAITGLQPGAPITPEIIARVMLHPQGIAKGAPAAARTVHFLNKVEDAVRLDMARRVARLLIDGGAERVVIGHATSPDPVEEVIFRGERGR